jgi:hypothetical protein
MSEPCLLVLIAHPELEEAVVDWLLSLERPPGFSSVAINGHAAEPQRMTIAEQVRGSRRQVQFQVQTDVDAARGWVDQLRQEFAGAGLHYWILPLLEGGHLE